MIVDEDVSILQQVKQILERDEHTVVTVQNSREALQHLSSSGEEAFDLVLVDTTLPDTKESAFFPTKPSSRLGIDTTDSFLQKPFTDEELRTFIQKHLTC